VKPRTAIVVGAVLILALLLAAGAGPDLPGPRLREKLGLVQDKPFQLKPCTPAAERTRTVDSPLPAPGRWRREPPAPVASAEASAVAVGGGIYVLGGSGEQGRSLATVLHLDPVRRRWKRLPDMPKPVDHPLAVAHGDDIYVVGGFVGSAGAVRDVWRYTTTTKTWKRLPSMRWARGALGGGISGGRLYAVGGQTENQPFVKPVPTVEVFDLQTGRWSYADDMPTARHHVSSAMVDGKLFALGGRRPGNEALDAVERFDPATGDWARLDPMPQGVGGAKTAVSRGEIVLTAGGDDRAWQEGKGWVTPSVWRWRPPNGPWRRLPDLQQARHGHETVIGADRIWVLQGAPCPGFGLSSSSESLALPSD